MTSKLNFSLIVLMGLIALTRALENPTKFYVAVHHKLNFHQSYEYCRRLDMQLVSIESKAKSDAVTQYLNSQGITLGQFWTAGNDIGEEGKFYWLTTGQRYTFTNWIRGQPDNHQGKENCMELNASKPSQFLWNDMPCDFKLNFICEKCVTKPTACPKC